jgi:hypothetical protein
MYLNIHTHHIEADDAIIQVENLIIDSSIPMEVWIKQLETLCQINIFRQDYILGI